MNRVAVCHIPVGMNLAELVWTERKEPLTMLAKERKRSIALGRFWGILIASLGLGIAVIPWSDACAQNIRGAATGPTTAPGFDHPGQYMHLKDVKPADNMYPVIQHPDQDKAARDKLAALQKKSGKKPNIFIFLMDDTGWMDPGFNGGGVALGNATPNMDKVANEGLLLTSAYSTPSCSPTRSTIHTGQNPLHHGILRPPMFLLPRQDEGQQEAFLSLSRNAWLPFRQLSA